MFPTWERLHRIRELPIYVFAKWALIAIPVLASAILFMHQHTTMRLALPVNFLSLYLAALFFYCGSLMTDVFCPEPIKEHRNYETFLKALATKAEMIAEMKSRRTAAQDQALEQLAGQVIEQVGGSPEAGKVQNLLAKILNEQGLNSFLDAAGPTWIRGNQDRKAIRIVITCFFIASALTALYVTLVDAPSRVFKAAL